jgi:glucokinase
VADYPGPVEAVRVYLGERTIGEAVFAVATPVVADRIALTNSHWDFSIEETRRTLGFDRLRVVNDFTAQALAIPVLRPDELQKIGGGEPVPGHPIGVIGPGTGLGVSGLLPAGDHWQPIPGEGGHVSLAPHDEVEQAVLSRLRARFGHVSNERVLSGPGLINLASALAALEGVELVLTEPMQVAERARSGACRFCAAALSRFSSILGAAAGDLALTLGARGGIYVGGGLCRSLGDLFERERFRAGFAAKGRLRYFVEPIPTYLVLHHDPGLLGAAALALTP